MKKILTILFFLLASTVSAHTFTANGDAQIDTAQSQFGGASGLFDGTGDYLSAPDHADWILGSGDWTFSFWVRQPAIDGTNESVVGQWASGSYGWIIQIDSTAITFVATTNCDLGTIFSLGPAVTIGTDAWIHVVAVRDGNTFRTFINGAAGGTGDLTGKTLPDCTGTLNIGRNGDASEYYSGWIDEFTFQKGTARWVTTFTPPTAEDCGPSLANTKFLLHMNGADTSTTFTDDAATSCGGAAVRRSDPIIIETDD